MLRQPFRNGRGPRRSRLLLGRGVAGFRLSRTFLVGRQRIDLTLDILNALNDTAEEGLATDDLFGKDDA